VDLLLSIGAGSGAMWRREFGGCKTCSAYELRSAEDELEESWFGKSRPLQRELQVP